MTLPSTDSATTPFDPCAQQLTYSTAVDPRRIGFAASGGGYRATLLHVGALWRLNELGWLIKIDRFSGVSGGSITLGRLAACWPDLSWSGGEATNFKTLVADPLIHFARGARLDLPAVLHGMLPWLRGCNYLERAYRDQLVGALRLNELPEHPQFTFNATSMQSGVSFRFTRVYARDYRVGCLPYPAISLAAAIAASSAFPPFLSPYRLDLRATPLLPVPNSPFDERFRTAVVLTDGGVYDNLGLQTLERFGTVIASDAGAAGVAEAAPTGVWPLQVLRVLALLSEQTRARRRHEFFERIGLGLRTGTLWTFKTLVADAPAPPDGVPLLHVDPDRQKQLAATPTRLWPFSEAVTFGLVNLGYALADAGLRSRMGVTGGAPRWPYPEHSLETPPTKPTRPLAGSPTASDA